MKPTDDNSGKGETMDDIGQLIQFAGARDAVEQQRYDTSHAHVRAHWQTIVAGRRRTRDRTRDRIRDRTRWRKMAVAAAVLVALAVPLVILNGSLAPPTLVASIERVQGRPIIEGAVAQPGRDIAPGTRVETDATSRIALRLAGGQSLRLDYQTRLSVLSPNHLELESGAVYIDTIPAHDTGSIAVQTALGIARDVGTQFQVRLADASLIVGVRDGTVQVTQWGKNAASVDKGRFLRLAANGDQDEIEVPADDHRWDWVQTLKPAFDIEGASLSDFLEWYARESGLELRWSDHSSPTNAQATVLHGSIEGMGLNQSIDLVSRIARFDFRIDEDTITVTVQ